jgi:hypothetical protein
VTLRAAQGSFTSRFRRSQSYAGEGGCLDTLRAVAWRVGGMQGARVLSTQNGRHDGPLARVSWGSSERRRAG